MNSATLPARPLPPPAAPALSWGWLARLAAWAERQPAHRRLGSWTAR